MFVNSIPKRERRKGVGVLAAEIVTLCGLLLVSLFFISCSTTSSFLDAALPDRYGLGSTFTTGSYRGSQQGFEGGGVVRESGSYNLDSIVTWLEWDIPSVGEEPVSVRGVRERAVQDYKEWREPEPPSDSLVSITKQTTVDETGMISESWSFGATEALSSALIGLLGFLGFRLARSHLSSSGGGDEE